MKEFLTVVLSTYAIVGLILFIREKRKPKDYYESRDIGGYR